jgi:hypothetical protein
MPRATKNQQLKMDVQGTEITVVSVGDEDYISLTDMTRKFGDETLIYSWMRNRNTLEFLGIWEELHNPNFKGNGFVTFKEQAGLNNFNLTPRKWIEATGAIGIRSQSGRNGGTYAHKDLAFEFGTWHNPSFKLFLIQEFQRLKEQENQREKLDWNLHRTLSKINYQVHTDAVATHIVPTLLTPAQIGYAYASEADILNMALFGKTAKQWRDENPQLARKGGNIRDTATIDQLLVLSNLEAMNAQMIEMQWQPAERLKRLNEVAVDLLKRMEERNSAAKMKKATNPKQLK